MRFFLPYRFRVQCTVGIVSLFTGLLSRSQTRSDSLHSVDQGRSDTSRSNFIRAAANPQLRGNGLKRFLIGTNYRAEWTTPIQLRILDFSAFRGGLTTEKEGGGKETRSLHVKDSTGDKWILRSVEKFPENAIPPVLRKTLAAKFVADGISASYPYGVLSMGVLSNAVHVPYFMNRLVWLGRDTALRKYQSKYRNLVMLMEDPQPTGILADSASENRLVDQKEKTINTQDVVLRLAKGQGDRVDQEAVLNGRLLDNFVMDFDRHEGQWEWRGIDSDGHKVYYPVPKDRDQVFYSSKGVLSKFVSGKGAHPELQGFRKKAKNIRTFNRPEQSFDHYFLNGLSEEQWSKLIDAFLRAVTDSVIDSALKCQPSELYKYSISRISGILKGRRQYFKEDMIQYYKFLSKTISIVGSNEPEQFSITRNGNGSVSVIIRTIDSSGNPSSTTYQRSFDPSVTREIRIYGLEGNDRFEVKGGGSPIRIRLIGGPGDDQFIGEGSSKKVAVYDVNFERNVFAGSKFHQHISSDPQNNSYKRLDDRFNLTSLGVSAEYSLDGGLFIGPRLKIITQGFRKEPYSMHQLFAVNRALNSSAYHIKYNVDFLKLFGGNDLVFRADLTVPTTRTHFFGMGNSTVFDKSKPGAQGYYLDRYDLFDVSLLARRDIKSWLQVRYGPEFQYFKLRQKENSAKYVSDLYANGSGSQYKGHSYAGGEIAFEINTKNDLLIPGRGIDFNVYNRILSGVHNSGSVVNETGGYLTLYTDFKSDKHVVLATSFGASYVAGRFRIEQAQYLGFKQSLRGFRIDRFAGRSRAYNNTEVRINLGDVNFGLFRGSFGVLGFNDIGRVWADQERSTKLHDGYGAGIWLAPLNRLVMVVSSAYSNEEKNLILITFGFQF